jgi:molybdate transport system permease protein
MKNARVSNLTLRLLGGALALFLVLPVLGLVASTGWGELRAGLAHPLVWPALRLSLLTTSVSLAIVILLGTPLAWVLARSTSRAARTLETLLQLPMVMPPAVAGIALLLTFGRRSWLAGVLYPEDSSLAFTTLAVIMAEVFVSAPFFLRAALAAFRRLDAQLLLVARSFGASQLRLLTHVGLPLASHGLAAGAAMSWARSLGEFGATLMFAGNLTDRTQTLPLAIYTALESDLRAAQALALVLMAVALALLIAMQVVLAAGRVSK